MVLKVPLSGSVWRCPGGARLGESQPRGGWLVTRRLLHWQLSRDINTNETTSVVCGWIWSEWCPKSGITLRPKHLSTYLQFPSPLMSLHTLDRSLMEPSPSAAGTTSPRDFHLLLCPSFSVSSVSSSQLELWLLTFQRVIMFLLCFLSTLCS